MEPTVDPAFDPVQRPELTDEQWERLRGFGVPEDVDAGDYLFRSGDRDYDLILVDEGEVEVVRDSLFWIDEAVLTRSGPRTFVGELGLLNGQGAFLSARATQPTRVLRVSRPELRRLMAEDDELCDIVLHALWARRESLRRGPAALTLKFVGQTSSSDFLALQRFAERLDLVHKSVEVSAADLGAHAKLGVSTEDLPIA
ncbi:MAG: Crp/Fnr family transcriptional regulator, partial [Microbacterium sp.]